MSEEKKEELTQEEKDKIEFNKQKVSKEAEEQLMEIYVDINL